MMYIFFYVKSLKFGCQRVVTNMFTEARYVTGEQSASPSKMAVAVNIRCDGNER